MATTSTWGKPFNTPYKGRRRNTRSYRNNLYNSTRFKPHYRSINDGSGVITTGSSVETAQVHIQRALFTATTRGGGTVFFDQGGGAFPIDEATPVPGFNGDIVIRGGIARVTVYNGNVEAVRVEVMSIWTVANPADLWATDFAAPAEWDPTVTPDFTRFGKILNRKSTILPPREGMMVTHKFAPQKLDQTIFRGVDGLTSDTPSGNTLFWFIKIIPMAVLASACVYTNTWNVSFVGDAIGAS